jgi:voltage-gated potassium channel
LRALFDGVHRAFHEPRTASYRVVTRVVWVLIVASVLLFALDLYLGPGAPEYQLLTFVDEWLLWLFGLEILLRVLSYRPPELEVFALRPAGRLRLHVLGRLRYCLRPLNLIDIITVLAVVPALRGLRALRALRLLRGSRFFRYSNPLRGILRAFEDNFLLYAAAFSFLGVSIMLGGVSLYLVDQAYNPGINTLSDAMWWAIVTITTVGYGDITPTTSTLLGRFVASALMVVGMFTLALFAGIVGHTMLNAVLSIREEQFRMTSFVNHVIVCGYEDGNRMFLETIASELRTDEVDVVIFAPGERPPEVPPEFTWMSGDPAKESELDKVRLTHAESVVILGSRAMDPQLADARTILIAFTIRSYLKRQQVTGARKRPVYIVSEVLESENVSHARTAGADEVIESTRVSFSMLAHAVVVHGTAAIMGQLAVMEAHNLYVGRFPAFLEGPGSFFEVSRALKGATGALLIGVRRAEGERYRLNPPDDMVVTREMQLIYLAERAVLEPV